MSYEAWGDGFEPGDCGNCDGTGLIVDEYEEDVDCPDCHGSGFREYEPLSDDVF